MINHKEHAELIRKAQLGDRACLSRLAEVARVHLREYVLRVTLQEDLTEDIVQESILEMFKVFEKLQNADRFWAWLHGIAFNKIRSHYGRRWRHKTISLSEVACEIATEDSQNALADMVNRELKQIVLRSMRELSPRHRAVLTMRCYKEMAYSDIARLMGCSEFGAQALFYRAKKALAKKLSGHGLGKGYLLTALVIFGKLTAATEASAANVSITAATLKVGAAASLAAMVTSKAAIVSLTAAGTIAASTVAITHGTYNNTDKKLQKVETQTSLNTPLQTPTNKPMEQCWYFFPEGAGGPVMIRMLEFSKSGKQSYCRYLQNEHANYFSDKTTIYINNYRMYNPDLSIRRLPTDSKDLAEFLSRIAGGPDDMEYTSNKGKGLLVISKRSGDHGDRIWRIDRHFNVLEEEYFQYDWPQSTKTIDNRDEMHRRGWTFFRISGRLNGQQVSGTGQIPFTYVTSKRFRPWLKMQIGSGLTIVDSGTAAGVFDRSGETKAIYPGGSFFKGLGQPWMGLHTIDTVRRDAAEKRVPFETKKISGGSKTEVALTHEQTKLVYTIDMETDVIEKITFSTDNGNEGELRFSYLQNIDGLGNQFTKPNARRNRQTQQEPPGMLWLAELAEKHR
jgi:RNA polymerase sigma-70 factor (ECF subfamily)